MNIKKSCIALVARGMFCALVPATTFAENVSTPAQPGIARDYLIEAPFDPVALFTTPGARLDLNLPQIGRLEILHVETIAVDSGGKVLRWSGRLKERSDLQAMFVRGMSGHITGLIDTPKGRLLLGNANGRYYLYDEAPESSLVSGENALPAILLPESLPGTASDSKHNAAVLDSKLVAYPVEFNIAGLAGLTPGQDAQISLPGAGDFVVTHDSTQAGDASGATFVGHLKDYGSDFRILVAYTPSGAQGSILTPYGEFQLQTVGAGQWLIDVSRSKLEQHTAQESDAATPEGVVGGPAAAGGGVDVIGAAGAVSAGATASTGTATTATTTGTSSSGKTQIDVLVVYTPGFEQRYGGPDQALNRLQLLTALSNQAYTDSNVSINLRMVAAVKLNLPDTTANTQMLSDMRTGSGYFASLASLRQTYGADLVTLVRPFYASAQGGNCGVGYVGGYGGTDIAQYKAYAVSVVSDGTDVTGQPYYCNNYTFAHELGHNMGSMHDRQTAQSQGGGIGAYPYSFGYGQSGAFGTIMSYIRPTVGKFSTPAVNCTTSNLACGVAASDTANAADNAQSLNNTRAKVAAFMATVNTLPLNITGVVASKGAPVANVTIQPSGTGTSCTKSGSNGVYSCQVPPNWTGTLTPSLSGYLFNPLSLSLSNVTTSQANKNFEASLIPPLTISGVVSASGRGLANVVISAVGAGASCSKTADNGSYTCIVPNGWSGGLVPVLSGYQFAPAVVAFGNLRTSQPARNFAALPIRR